MFGVLATKRGRRVNAPGLNCRFMLNCSSRLDPIIVRIERVCLACLPYGYCLSALPKFEFYVEAAETVKDHHRREIPKGGCINCHPVRRNLSPEETNSVNSDNLL